jgi:Spy/CpxP family protein refolding chaperone
MLLIKKKKMKKTKSMTLIIILLVFAVSFISKAQDNTQAEDIPKYKCTPEEQAKKITEKMKGKLDLTDEQYSKILKLQTDRITYMRELRSKDLISRSEVKQKREEFRNGMKNILTDEQKNKIKMMKEKHMKHRKHKR